MNKIADIIGTPKFSIGDLVLHKCEWDDLNVPVAWSVQQGMITGISYCGNNYSNKSGWLYTFICYRDNNYFPDGSFESEYQPCLPLDDLIEEELELDFYPSLDAKTIVEIRKMKVMNQVEAYINFINTLKWT
jgi:hypothetical protein